MAAHAAVPSLRARALRWLAQRESSRAELRRRLLPHALADAGRDAAEHDSAGAQAAGCAGPRAEPCSNPRAAAEARVDALLDALERDGQLSAERFVEARVHARVARCGTRRIETELAGHGVALPDEVGAALRAGELERAQALWQRRFGAPAADAAGRARQARFLIGRGFSSAVVRRVVRGLEEPDA